MAKQRYFLELAYDGTKYHGWQIQLKDISVQETISKAVSKILSEEITVIGCGRTDTGVHASRYFAHFSSIKEINENFLYNINCVLPKDISIINVYDFGPEAHARYDATKRTYAYYFHFNKNPFLERYSTYYPFYTLNFKVLQKAAKELKRYDQFKPLCRYSTKYKSTNCRIFESRWEQIDENRIRYVVAANRFLRSMVRRMVGVSVLLATSRMDFKTFNEIMDRQGEFRHKLSMPPQGLFLEDVEYPYLKSQ
ncbi:MAG: tRNA pseudouridine synthase A [Chitinophagales bacterium]|nr:tRNA pseudouridine synthase A [Chitinophagales bacterium]